MAELPRQIEVLNSAQPDDALVVAASWEERCLGLVRRLGQYRAQRVFLVVYDGLSDLRSKHIAELNQRLGAVGTIHRVDTTHAYPLASVREIVSEVDKSVDRRVPRIAIDVTTFTRKHLLQLLQGLDVAGLLGDCRLYHTESSDYATQDNEMMADGVSEIRVVDSFMGSNRPSQDSVLIIFLGYEGGRALALWEHLEPNITIAVIPDPPYSPNWAGRTEDQNRYLLSSLPSDHVYRSHSLIPEQTTVLLERLMFSGRFGSGSYRFQIAPLGTKAQTIGVYQFWRRHPQLSTIVYADPKRYRQERATFPPGQTWCIADTASWEALPKKPQ